MQAFAGKLEKANSILGEDALEVPVLDGDEEDLELWLAWRNTLKATAAEAEKLLKKKQSTGAAAEADAKLVELIAAASGEVPLIAKSFEGTPALLQELLNGLKKRQFPGIGVMVVNDGEKVHVGISVASGFTDRFQAGQLMGELAPLVNGRGGGKAEMARGAGSDPSGVEALLAKSRELIA